MTKSQRFLIAITVLNGAFTVLSLSQVQQVWAAPDAAPVLRGRGLEIVDDSGRVRASIKVHPADPKVRLPDGTTQPETVVLRLVNANTGPGVKIASSEDSAGFALIVGQGNYLQVASDGIKLTKGSQLRATWP